MLDRVNLELLHFHFIISKDEVDDFALFRGILPQLENVFLRRFTLLGDFVAVAKTRNIVDAASDCDICVKLIGDVEIARNKERGACRRQFRSYGEESILRLLYERSCRRDQGACSHSRTFYRSVCSEFAPRYRPETRGVPSFAGLVGSLAEPERAAVKQVDHILLIENRHEFALRTPSSLPTPIDS